MSFKPIDRVLLGVVDGTVSSARVIKIYCGHFLEGLQTFYSHQHIQQAWDVGFSFDEQLRSKVDTPYGNARGALSLQIVDGTITGRYVFEKRIASEDGSEIWRQVWAVRITSQGNVLLGDEGDVIVAVESTHAMSNAFDQAARSLLYSIGVNPIFPN
ncbi:hypothetical protein [Pseudomonas sp. MH9.3]|uniref:hypothetical protein n=1 Tax=Pseudomonas sp. MH9.3 TaxID=3048630 RepID=UPI002AC91279|nr:hypothetical protein [Pseudomonas sp. MH9.3]MEB0106142.1 hypothetical protein [Pseudomonas sp. MH9.3]WPX80439.1 hypothetical protein RHM60_04810 [Pseudomonas sp. MH9.3]WQG57627.1 hypothetical protein RHM66_22020 [Pseudomonas sp. RTB3]